MDWSFMHSAAHALHCTVNLLLSFLLSLPFISLSLPLSGIGRIHVVVTDTCVYNIWSKQVIQVVGPLARGMPKICQKSPLLATEWIKMCFLYEVLRGWGSKSSLLGRKGPLCLVPLLHRSSLSLKSSTWHIILYVSICVYFCSSTLWFQVIS